VSGVWCLVSLTISLTIVTVVVRDDARCVVGDVRPLAVQVKSAISGQQLLAKYLTAAETAAAGPAGAARDNDGGTDL
jgi:hypothetical protein